ncbi:hypothetical protein [Nocardiopsis sp. CNT312]|uniref:hypothetical protein n=1 Tax=Nocardiopsis sp. CNT312 TaxID=1137268 RepID=UPI0004B65AF7|nr:hypothetical protein [Nocardiopsis sp. CNT312]
MREHMTTSWAGDWFADAEITPKTVRALHRIGPGGVIVADALTRRFRVMHSRRLDAADAARYIVYGHGDLRQDLADFPCGYGDRDWEYLVAAIDETSRDCLDDWIDEAARIRPTGQRLRRELRARGFDPDARTAFPLVNGRETYIDHYTDRTSPHITVTVKAPCDHDPDTRVLVRVFDRGGHASAAPYRIANPLTAGPAALRVRERVDAYLRRSTRT